jgi:hypothetical protein
LDGHDGLACVSTYGIPVPAVMALRVEIRQICPDVTLDDLDAITKKLASSIPHPEQLAVKS